MTMNSFHGVIAEITATRKRREAHWRAMPDPVTPEWVQGSLDFGYTLIDIHILKDIPMRTVRRLAGRPQKGNTRPVGSPQRDEILRRHEAGESQTAIARALGISRQRVHQHLKAPVPEVRYDQLPPARPKRCLLYTSPSPRD